MFEAMTPPPPDKILSLMETFRADERRQKIDLGVGVYRNEQGLTPILDVVRRTEARQDAEATTKTYVGPGGDPRFVELVCDLAFGPSAPRDRLAGVQTTGGAGALRVLAGLIARQRPGATVHVPNPTWVNHLAVLSDAGLKATPYHYYDAAGGTVAIEAMLDDVDRMQAGDIILLHGCCHNPTGADPSVDEWERIIGAVVARGLTPFVDIAYQGFGDGTDEDAAALRLLAGRVPEMVVAYSCSKNFGIYRDRTGAAFVLSRNATTSAAARGRLAEQNRILYSMPPDHGAAIVRDILADAASRDEWLNELTAMRSRVQDMRGRLAAALSKIEQGRFTSLARQKGMFSLLPLNPEEVERLQRDHGIYLVSDGRISLAGLEGGQIQHLANAIAAVI